MSLRATPLASLAMTVKIEYFLVSVLIKYDNDYN